MIKGWVPGAPVAVPATLAAGREPFNPEDWTPNHGLDALAANLRDLYERYGRPVLVAETAYPWTLDWADATHNPVGRADQLLPGLPATPAGQAAFAHKRVAAAQMISGVGGEFEQAHQVIDRALDDAG